MKSFRDQLKECERTGNAFVKPHNPVVYCKKKFCQCMSSVCREEREAESEVKNG
jgi:hypothetical protein